MLTEGKAQPVPGQKYRLVTRSDMDGLICAVILKDLGFVDEVVFAHPKDMQDGKVPVTDKDITTNLPYVPGVFLCFDHHSSEMTRNRPPSAANYVLAPDAPSAARVVFEFFGGASNPILARLSPDMMSMVDKADSGAFTKEEVLHPEGWVLLSFLMDARTGLGRFHNFKISNFQLMHKLIDYCRELPTIDQIMALPDIKERVDLYMEHKISARAQIERSCTVYKNLVILDLRHEDTIYATNRFTIYALFPKCNISMHVIWGKGDQNTVLAVGKSILNRTSNTHVGNLMLEYGGGGHEAAGTCQIPTAKVESTVLELIARINKDG